MKQDCLDLLTKLEKCLEDDEFQVILMLRLSKKLTKYLKGEKDE